MLSLILYGRNDAHGYNLHKRAAISLNAIAEVLSDPTDEIIFIDYNTPDELPTFLETLVDTLTERARRYIRVIRVRPSFHRQFAGKTSLVALESQSRNIAIRRANPDNRWILSTNTDMIFLPQKEGSSLSSICGSLADGFYHLPRFELPESFWERSDRMDPRSMIDTLRAYGRRYHLNEVVYGAYDNLYEAPGDFQLFLREDLFRIGGFDETMIRGWHVDTNMARRMKLLRGKVDTVFPLLSGYHCGHTRQATSLHGAKRTENSLEVYARNVKSAYWTEDHRGWGAPDETFEEVRLTESRTPLFIGALDAAITQDGPAYSEATYNESTFCEEGFDAAHVLPHLGDIVFNMPVDQTLFMVGSDIDLIEGFERFISSPPMNAQLFLCADDNSPGEDYPGPVLDLDEGLNRADIVVIQFPNARTAPREERADLEWYAQYALERFIEIERKRNRADRRRVIVINGIHSRLQDLMWDTLDAAAIPYSGRIRQGHVIDVHWQKHPPADTSPADKSVCRALGRTRAFAPSELEALQRIFAAAADELEIPEWHRLAPEVAAIATQPDFLAVRFGLTPDQAAGLAMLARSEIERAAARCIVPPIEVKARPDVANRIASTTDWEDDAWLSLGLRYFGERAYTMTTRSRWVWERLALLHELRRRVPPVHRPWILIVGDGPDPLAAMAAHQGYRVAYATTSKLLQGEPTPEWKEVFQIDNIVVPGSLLPLDRIPPNVQFAAMLSPGSSLFSWEAERPSKVAIKVVSRMMSRAHLGASSLVHLNHNNGGGALGWSEFRDALTPGGVLHDAGLRGDAPVDARIPIDAAVRYALEDKDSDTAAGLSFGFDTNAIVTIGMLWARFPEKPDQKEPVQSASPRRAPRPPSPPRAARPPQASPSSSAPPQPLAPSIAGSSKPGLAKTTLEPARSPIEQKRPAKAPAVSRALAPIAVAPDIAARRSAFAAGRRSRILSYPAIFPNLRRNLLPSLMSAAPPRERTALRVVLPADADGYVRFAAPVADFGPGVCSIQVGVAGVYKGEPGASFVGEQASIGGRVSVDHGTVSAVFHANRPSGDGLVVFEFAADTLEINLLSAARETPAEALTER